MPNTPLLSVVDGLDASGIHRTVWPSRSPHLVLAHARVLGPVQVVAATPHLRISCNVGPPYAFQIAGQPATQTFTCRKHALQIIPPDLELIQQASWPLPRGRQRKAVLLATVNISRQLAQDAAFELGLPAAAAMPAHQVLSPDEPLHALMQALLSDLQHQSPDGPVATEQLAKLVLSRLMLREQARKALPEHNAIGRVLAHIAAHPLEALSLETLAQVAGWSVFHFCRVFRETTGVSAHRYVLERRLQHAQRLLWADDGSTGSPMSMLDIALACGFQTPSHFSASFKRHTGKTPLQWRAAQRDAARGANGFSIG